MGERDPSTWRSCASAATTRWTATTPRSPRSWSGRSTVIPCHYDTFPPIETDAAGVQVGRGVADGGASAECSSPAVARCSRPGARRAGRRPLRSCAISAVPRSARAPWRRLRARRRRAVRHREAIAVPCRPDDRDPAGARLAADDRRPERAGRETRGGRRETEPRPPRPRRDAPSTATEPSGPGADALARGPAGRRGRRGARAVAGGAHRPRRADHAARGARARVHLDPGGAALRRRRPYVLRFGGRTLARRRRAALGLDASPACARARRWSGSRRRRGQPGAIEATAEPGP